MRVLLLPRARKLLGSRFRYSVSIFQLAENVCVKVELTFYGLTCIDLEDRLEFPLLLGHTFLNCCFWVIFLKICWSFACLTSDFFFPAIGFVPVFPWLLTSYGRCTTTLRLRCPDRLSGR